MLDTHYSETAARLSSGKNIAVLGACRDNEYARESAIYDGGFFTQSIVSAFSGYAAQDDGRITLESLFGYVSERVSRMSRTRQNPFMYIPDGMRDPLLGLVER